MTFQIEVLEIQKDSAEDSSVIMLDTPEAILKQRIKELEKMERHFKQQVNYCNDPSQQRTLRVLPANCLGMPQIMMAVGFSGHDSV